MDENLTAANYKLARNAYKHSYTLVSWASQGKVFAKLKNGKTVRIKYGADINELFKKAMPAGNLYIHRHSGIAGAFVVLIMASLSVLITVGHLYSLSLSLSPPLPSLPCLPLSQYY